MTIDDDDELSAADLDALSRALTLAKRESPGRRAQIEQMQHEDGRHSAASFAAFHCQCKSLKLRPWQSPPMYGHLDGDTGATILLKRLLNAGLSRWEPDPLGALARVEAYTQREPPAAA